MTLSLCPLLTLPHPLKFLTPTDWLQTQTVCSSWQTNHAPTFCWWQNPHLPFPQRHHSLNQSFCMTVLRRSAKRYFTAFSSKHSLCLTGKIKNSAISLAKPWTPSWLSQPYKVYAQDKFFLIYSSELFQVNCAIQTLCFPLKRQDLLTCLLCLSHSLKAYLSFSPFSAQLVLHQPSLTGDPPLWHRGIRSM